jgi:opacity protein-like surface antigen
MYKLFCGTLTALVVVVSASTAHAQTPAKQPQVKAPEQRWSVDFAIGFDNSISGNINSSAIGTLNGQTTVILKNKYEDVYGTGLHLRFGGGYMWKENQEFRVSFTLQQLDADLVQLGEYGAATLYGQFDDYESFSLDLGYRQYMPLRGTLRGYGEGLIGLGFISETDVVLAAPQANLVDDATDFYDRTAAFTLGVNVGVMGEVRKNFDAFGQIGLRFVTGMSQPDNLFGSGLEEINDNSSRWAIPFSVGVRFRF